MLFDADTVHALHTPSRTEAQWFDVVRALTVELVALPTISPDIAGENACAQAIARLLAQDTGLQPALWPTGDGRYSVACLLQGEGPRNDGQTVILMGHYDTVGVTEYEGLMAITGNPQVAFDTAALRAALAEALQTRRSPDDDDAWRDLGATWRRDGHDEPAWLFGRGALDMKSGVAAAIAVMRALWEARATLAGNVLLLACPDEENESHGVRSAGAHLLDLRARCGLRYAGVINTDYVAPRESALLAAAHSPRAIYAGTIGKLLPSFYVIGVPTHVGEPFRGVDADHVAARLVERITLNPDLCDRWTNEVGETALVVPPVSLRMRDLKSAYSAQTVTEAFACINWLTCAQTPDAVLRQVMVEAEAALDDVLAARDARWAAYARAGGFAPRPPEYQPLVLTFEALCARVRAVNGWPERADDAAGDDPLVALMDAVAAEADALVGDPALQAHQLAYEADLPEKSRLIVARLVREANIKGPAIIAFFAPPFYPHVAPGGGPLLRSAAREAAHAGINIELHDFYPYISDLSYLRLDPAVEAGLAALTANMPLFGRGYSLDFDTMRALDCEVINIGPWGKDAHSLYERVYAPYAFQQVPQLIFDVIKDVLTS